MGNPRICPKCSETSIVVIDSRETPDGEIVRRRKCKYCGERFNTIEVDADMAAEWKKAYAEKISKKQKGFPRKYKTRPKEIKAIQFTGDNTIELDKFVGDKVEMFDISTFSDRHAKYAVMLHSVDGDVSVTPGDHIVKISDTEFSKCSHMDFQQQYMEVETADE